MSSVKQTKKQPGRRKMIIFCQKKIVHTAGRKKDQFFAKNKIVHTSAKKGLSLA